MKQIWQISLDTFHSSDHRLFIVCTERIVRYLLTSVTREALLFPGTKNDQKNRCVSNHVFLTLETSIKKNWIICIRRVYCIRQRWTLTSSHERRWRRTIVVHKVVHDPLSSVSREKTCLQDSLDILRWTLLEDMFLGTLYIVMLYQMQTATGLCNIHLLEFIKLFFLVVVFSLHGKTLMLNTY